MDGHLPFPRLICLCLSFFFPLLLFGQEERTIISGTVKNLEGVPLMGANVTIKNTSRGTATDADGQYTIEASPEEVLVFSYLGYYPSEQEVGAQNEWHITLRPLIEQLEAIQVVGYGSQKKKDITGATASVEKEQFNRGIINSPEQLIQGKLAGVEVIRNNGEPGAGFTVRIRGASTIRAGNDPLYVVDGYPLDIRNNSPGDPFAETFFPPVSPEQNPLAFLNPDDIESITVLKDASAAAIYGARGANGVILITTKSGQAGSARVSYSAYGSLSYLPEKIDVLTADEYRAAQADFGISGNDFGGNTDWQEEIFRPAFSHNHNLSFSGGNSRTNYRASFNYLDQEGILEKSEWHRYSGSLKLQHRALQGRLRFDGNLSLSRIQEQRPAPGVWFQSLVFKALNSNPTWPVYGLNGDFFEPSPTNQHALATIAYTNDQTGTNRLRANLSATLKIIEGLEYRINTGGDISQATRRTTEAIPLARDIGGRATIAERELGNYLIEHYLTFEPALGPKHQLSLLGGYSYQEFTVKDFLFARGGFANDEILHVNNIGAGSIPLNNQSGAEKNALQSFFGRLNYRFQDRYLLTANFRADGSTRFGKDNRYGHFPSLAVGWRISEEAFFPKGRALDELKLRASWGLTGNQEIPNKITQAAFGTPFTGQYVLDPSGQSLAGYTYVRTPNPGLRWEESRQLNFGLDLSFLAGRAYGTIDYFHKRTTHLLLEFFASSAPTPTVWANLDGKLDNRGVELSLGGEVIKRKNFRWETALNFTRIRNEVRGLQASLFTEQQTITNGRPLGSFWGLAWLGFDENGLSRHKKNTLGVDAPEVIGQALPGFSWGITNSFTYKAFSLSFLINGVQGFDVYNALYRFALSKPNLVFGENTTQEVLDTEESFSNSTDFSSRYIEDGAFVRLNNLTLGYRPELKQTAWLNQLRVYFTATNLFLITKYRGYDPESNSVTGGVDRFGHPMGVPEIGVDQGLYPRARTFQLGLQVAFD